MPLLGAHPQADRMIEELAAALGRVLRAGFAALLAVRRPRPIHSRGRVLRGWITWLDGASTSGIRWIDEHPGEPLPIVARLSRSLGLPAPLPDILGLALRVGTDAGPADIELSSTGLGIPSRFMLLPHRSPSSARFGSLLPYRSALGPILICAIPLAPADLPSGGEALDKALTREPWRLRLHHATPTGRWHPFAEISLHLADDQSDEALRFDSVRHHLPGAEIYPWHRRLQQPSYRFVQEGAGHIGR
jgi:hypothetical protein